MIADVLIVGLLAWLCRQGYQQRRPWLLLTGRFLERVYAGRSFWLQLVTLGPLLVGWLLLCHWLNTHGWHGLAAGGILLAMTLGLQAMRDLEERQKWEREQCETCE